MDDLFLRLQTLLETPVITLEDPVTVSQILVLIATVSVSVVVAGFLRWWFRRLFHRLSLSERLTGRYLAVLFLIVVILGVSVALRVAGIGTGVVGKFLHYPLGDLFRADSVAGGGNLTFARLFYGCVIVLGVFILSKYLQWVLRREVLEAFQIAEHTRFLLLRVFHFALIVVGIIIALTTVGLHLTSLAIIFGGLSIGLGFGLQNIASNLISGVILIFERPIKIGDLVEIPELATFGRVSSINLRSTVIVALDEKDIIVPNSKMITENVHNLTHANEHFRLRIPVGVSYGSDVQRVKQVLLEVAAEYPDVIKEPNPEMAHVSPPLVRFIRFGTSSLDFELLAWIPDCFQRFDIASDLHFLIHKKFKEHNITIAFPQRDVHVYTQPERVSGP